MAYAFFDGSDGKTEEETPQDIELSNDAEVPSSPPIDSRIDSEQFDLEQQVPVRDTSSNESLSHLTNSRTNYTHNEGIIEV